MLSKFRLVDVFTRVTDHQQKEGIINAFTTNSHLKGMSPYIRY